MDEQGRQLARVRDNIAGWVHGFVAQNPRFRGASLCEYVQSCARETGAEVSPESALRVLRDLRKRGVVDVRNVDRANSIYEVSEVRPLSYVKPPRVPVQLDLREVG